FFFFQAEDGIRDYKVTGVQTCALPISGGVERAFANRCTHARASLSEGTLDPARCAVTCPWHEGVFSLETGQVLAGPPALPIGIRSEERRVGKGGRWRGCGGRQRRTKIE